MSRGRPLDTDISIYGNYQVVKPLGVQSGLVTPWFNQPGFGIQYLLPKSINELINNGFITKIN